jgi:organic hydroperoxide reductase OsmC/OhrA
MGSSKFINQEIKMWYLVIVDQHIAQEMIMKAGKKCCISNALDETDVDMLWNGSEKDRNVTS